MEKVSLISKISELYNQGKNVIQYLKDIEGRDSNTIEDILISYDFQAGSYIQYVKENPVFNFNYTQALAKIIRNLIANGSVVEVGVGDATTLGNVAAKLGPEFTYGGLDISWSRIFYAKEYLSKLNVNASLFTGDLFKMPFADNCIDLVYSSHSLEPNGGREEEALEELYRVTSNYLVLLEPDSELANEQGKERMRRNGYISKLKDIIEGLNYNLITYRKFEFSFNSLNPTALYVIKKTDPGHFKSKIDLVCPISHSTLIEREDHFFSPKALVSYPKILGIPCLIINNAILTTKML